MYAYALSGLFCKNSLSKQGSFADEMALLQMKSCDLGSLPIVNLTRVRERERERENKREIERERASARAHLVCGCLCGCVWVYMCVGVCLCLEKPHSYKFLIIQILYSQIYDTCI